MRLEVLKPCIDKRGRIAGGGGGDRDQSFPGRCPWGMFPLDGVKKRAGAIEWKYEILAVA